MNYTKELLENDRVKFTVEVDEEQWKQALQEAYIKTKGKFNIPGFRKGHAPRAFIERMYGTAIFYDDAMDIVLPKSYNEVLDKEPDLFPVDRPDVKISAISDSTFKYTAEVQLKPTVKLGQYSGLEFTVDKVKVSKEDVESEIKSARDNAGWWEEVSDRPAQNGDKVKIDYSGSVDGVKFDGSGTFIPGFEDGVVGMNVGESKDVEVTFPAEYHADNLAGKAAVFAVKVKAITVKKIPEADDEFAKDVSEFDTFKEYEADVKEKIKQRREDQAKAKLEQEMVKKVVENSEVKIPQCMIDEEAEEMVNEFGYRLSYQGLNIEDYYKYTGTTKEKMLGDYAERATESVKTRLVLEALIKEAKLEVTDKDTDAVLKEMAEKENKTLEEYKKDFNEHYMAYVRNEAMTRNLMKYLKSSNTVK